MMMVRGVVVFVVGVFCFIVMVALVAVIVVMVALSVMMGVTYAERVAGSSHVEAFRFCRFLSFSSSATGERWL